MMGTTIIISIVQTFATVLLTVVIVHQNDAQHGHRYHHDVCDHGDRVDDNDMMIMKVNRRSKSITSNRDNM